MLTEHQALGGQVGKKNPLCAGMPVPYLYVSIQIAYDLLLT
jgi:hypothetical protein